MKGNLFNLFGFQMNTAYDWNILSVCPHVLEKLFWGEALVSFCEVLNCPYAKYHILFSLLSFVKEKIKAEKKDKKSYSED